MAQRNSFLTKTLPLFLVLCLILVAVAPVTASANEADPANFSPDGLTTSGYFQGDVWVEGGQSTKTDPTSGVTYSMFATAVGYNEFDITYQIQTSVVQTQNKTSAGAATVLVIDVSGSMGIYEGSQSRLDSVQDAATTFLAKYAGTDSTQTRYISIVAFDDYATVEMDWGNVAGGPGCNQYDAAVSCINALYDDGLTYINRGLDTANSQIQSSVVDGITSKNVLLFTDGRYEGPTESQVTSAASALQQNATVYTIAAYGASGTYATWMANYVASSPDKAFEASNVDQINVAFSEIGDAIISGLDGDGFIITDTYSDFASVENSKELSLILDKANAVVTTSGRIETGLTTTYTYTYTVRVKLDTENITDFDPTKFYPVSTGASLDLGNGTVADLDFAVPGIRLEATEILSNVIYDANDGTGAVPEDTAQYKPGDKVTVKFQPAPTRQGYVFLGWGETATQKIPTYSVNTLDYFYIGSEDVTLYAIWEEATDATYTVTYNANGGTGDVPTDGNSYHYGDTVTVKFDAVLTLEGFAFVGWAGTPNATAADYTANGVTAFQIGKDDVTLYAVWASPSCDHQWEEISRTEPTCTEDGYIDYACKNQGCAATKQEIIEKLGHQFGSEYKWDDNSHWQECACGATSDPEAHTYGQWVITKENGVNVEGTRERECTACGHKQVETIPAISNPATGDSTPAGLLFALMALSACGILAVVTVPKFIPVLVKKD